MLDDRTAAMPERKMSFKQYKKMKIIMLERDFCIPLTDEELKRAESLQSEIQSVIGSNVTSVQGNYQGGSDRGVVFADISAKEFQPIKSKVFCHAIAMFYYIRL